MESALIGAGHVGDQVGHGEARNSGPEILLVSLDLLCRPAKI